MTDRKANFSYKALNKWIEGEIAERGLTEHVSNPDFNWSGYVLASARRRGLSDYEDIAVTVLTDLLIHRKILDKFVPDGEHKLDNYFQRAVTNALHNHLRDSRRELDREGPHLSIVPHKVNPGNYAISEQELSRRTSTSTPIRTEVQLIRDMLRTKVHGDVLVEVFDTLSQMAGASYPSVADALNHAGVTTDQGNQWTAKSVGNAIRRMRGFVSEFLQTGGEELDAIREMWESTRDVQHRGDYRRRSGRDTAITIATRV